VNNTLKIDIQQRTIGPLNAPVVIVGDAPSKYDYDSENVISRNAQQVLLDFVEQAGFDAEKILYVPCYSGPKTHDLVLTGDILRDDAKEFLIPTILSYPRKIVIPLGNNALCACGVVENPEKINSYCGKELKSDVLPGIKLAASIHPAFVITKPDENDERFYRDLRFAHRLASGKQVGGLPPITIRDIETPEQVIDLMNACLRSGNCAWDSETTGLDRNNDLVVSMAFYCGEKDALGNHVVWFWGSHDRLMLRFSNDILDNFWAMWTEFFLRARKGDFSLIAHNRKFDDGIVGSHMIPFGFPIHATFTERDTQFEDWTLFKHCNHGLKDACERILGWPEYDAPVSEEVSNIAKRRDKVMYKENPENADDFRVLEWLGVKPLLGKYVKKTDQQGYKWPTKDAVKKHNEENPDDQVRVVDKKACAYAMIPYDVLRTYNCYDALGTYLLDEWYMDRIEQDPKLQMSCWLRHVVGTRLLSTEMRGMEMDIPKNREISKLYEQLVQEADIKIRSAVSKLRPDITDFNPQSQQDLRAVLFGARVNLPHIDPRSLYDWFDRRSVDEKLSRFHDLFYKDYREVSEAAKSGSYDETRTREALIKAFKAFMGASCPLEFNIPEKRWHRKDNVIYVKLIDKAIFPFGLYAPDPKAFTKGGDPSVASEVLKNLYKQKPEPFLQLILMRAKAAKLKSTFVDGIFEKLDEYGVLHPEYNVTGTKAGRLSSRNPNGQNFVAYLRGQLRARKGKRIVTFDLSQAEIRAVAALSGDTALMEAMYSEDFHKTTASLVWGIPIEEVTKSQRQACKTLNFGLIYGMSAFLLAMTLGIAVEEAEDLMRIYFARFPKLCAWLDNQKQIARDLCYVETVFGTRLNTRNILSTDKKIVAHTERIAMNAPVQGTAGELTLWYIDVIMSEWEARYPNHPIYLVNTTHDSGSFECEIAMTERLEALIEEVINNRRVPFPPLDSVWFKCDVETTDAWYGEPDPMKALERDYGTEKQELPWHLILGYSEDADEKSEIEEYKEMEEKFYADREANAN